MLAKQLDKIIAKLYECSQELALEAFLAKDRKEVEVLYDASHLVDLAILKLKQGDIRVNKAS